MAAELSSPTYGHWGLDKPSIERQSRPSTESFDNTEEKMRVAPSMAELRAALEEKKSKVVFHEEYLSSEEALSPIEPEMEISDHDPFIQEEIDDMNLDDEIIKAIRESIFEMAVQMPIRMVGKPSIVDIPPTPSSSEPASRQQSKNGKDKKRPTLKTRLSATSFAQLSAPSSGENSPFRPSTAYSKYRMDSTGSEPSSPEQNSSCTATPVTLKKPPQAAFIFADPFATEHGSYAFQPNDVVKEHYYEPVTPSTTTPAIKPRYERLRTLSSKISSLGKRTKAPEVPPKEERRFSISSLSPSSSVSSRKVAKLEARGASERSPTIEIPPCPYDTDDEHVSPQSARGADVYRKPHPRRLRSGSLLALSETLQTKITLV
jgi:hypothetical protein